MSSVEPATESSSTGGRFLWLFHGGFALLCGITLLLAGNQPGPAILALTVLYNTALPAACLLAGDRDSISDFSPRGIMRRLVWSGGQVPEREDALIDAMFRVHIGDRELPGDYEASPNWPYVRPGKWGATNAMSPQYATGLVERILQAEPKVPTLWIYGAEDLAVSNTAASDPGTWGPTGRLPGFPGSEAFPPQPMMDQIRRMLEAYRERGGTVEEVAIDDAGHVPFITHPEPFNRAFHAHLERIVTTETEHA